MARWVHDISVLNQNFVDQVAANKDPEIANSQRTLACRVPTRWNADFDCLDAHVFFKDIVQAMTGVCANKLTAYCLNDGQWNLSDKFWKFLRYCLIFHLNKLIKNTCIAF